MFKIILILLVLFGAALYAPQTRPVVLETISPVVNPVLGWQTKGEMDRIVRELQTRVEQGSSLPEPGNPFQGWMNRHFFGGASVDAWGVAYTLQIKRDSVQLVSNGPDQEIGTADDMSRLVLIQPRERGRQR
ncbi:MAG: hypothetical protein PVJ76_05110 [Gemmatimonadota bacterium]